LDFQGIVGQKKILFLPKISRQAVGPILPPIQWAQGAVALEINHQMLAADHTFSFRVVVKNEWSYSSTSSVPQLCAKGKFSEHSVCSIFIGR